MFMKAVAPAQIDPIGDVVVPIFILMVSLLFSLYVSRLARRDSLRDFQFQRDLRYSDEYLSATQQITASMIIDVEQLGANYTRSLTHVLNSNFNRFIEFASGQADIYLGTALSGNWNLIDAAQVKSEHPLGSPAVYFSDEEIDTVQYAITDMAFMIKCWPYPERRKEVLSMVYDFSRRGHPADLIGTKELTVAIWLLEVNRSTSGNWRWIRLWITRTRAFKHRVQLGGLAGELNDFVENGRTAHTIKKRRRSESHALRRWRKEQLVGQRLKVQARRYQERMDGSRD
jgi:hypothetical protein